MVFLIQDILTLQYPTILLLYGTCAILGTCLVPEAIFIRSIRRFRTKKQNIVHGQLIVLLETLWFLHGDAPISSYKVTNQIIIKLII